MSISNVVKPKTQKGKRVLELRAPKIIENDKCTLILKGGNTSNVVTELLDRMCTLKNPLVKKLKWRNPALPFDDMTFIEKMCNKYDCSLFIIGLHSKKRPNNIIFGRLHDGELLDMFEMGITNYQSSTGGDIGIFGSKPMLIFSGEHFDETRQFTILRSLLTDMFRGPTVEKIRTLGIDHQIHFTLSSESKLHMRIRSLLYEKPLDKLPTSDSQQSNECETHEVGDCLRTPWGLPIRISLQDTGPKVDFVLRRVKLPSEDKWKRAHRIPHETKVVKKKLKNRHTDVFGSRIGRVNVGKLEPLEKLRPAASLRTALTGHKKQGFDRHKRASQTTDTSSAKKRKRSS